MVNYDMPWNPTRLEQRMGRIHRFGQKREVYVFNFVAVAGPRGPEEQPVVEGRVLQRLPDPRTREPYRLHFFELDLEGESLGDPGEPPRSLPVHARLVAVQENHDGTPGGTARHPARPDAGSRGAACFVGHAHERRADTR